MTEIEKRNEVTLTTAGTDYSTLVHIDTISDNTGLNTGTITQNDLTEDEHNLTASAVNAAGESVQTADFSITVDTVISKPVVDFIADNQGSTTGNVVSGGLTDDTSPELKGTAEANSVGSIYDNNHILTAIASDAAGNTGEKPTDFVTNIEPQVTHELSIIGIYEDSGSLINYAGETTDTTPTLTGTADPGALVWISDVSYYLDNPYGVLGTVIADSDGNWSFTVPAGIYQDQEYITTHVFNARYYDTDTGLPTDFSAPYLLDFVKNSTTTFTEQLPGVHDDSPDVMTLAQTSEHTPAIADITDHQHNTLKLSLDDILSEAYDNLFVQDGKQQLAVTGDAGDVVELKMEDIAHDWQNGGQVTADGVQYEVYQHAELNVELLVQQGVELHQVS